MITFLLVLFFIFAILLVFVVILQSQREGHLDMFGSSGSPFGVKTSSVLNKFTTITGIIFFLIVFLLSLSYNRIASAERKKAKSIEQVIEKTQKNKTENGFIDIKSNASNKNNSDEDNSDKKEENK